MTDMCSGIAWPDDTAGDLCGEDPWCRCEPDTKTVPTGAIDQTDLALLDALQDDISLVSRPYDVIATRLGISPDDVMQRLAGLQERGIVRGLSPVLESRQVGLTATTLVAIRVTGEKIKEVTRLINAYPEVSHNYPAGPCLFDLVYGRGKGRKPDPGDYRGDQAAGRAL